MWKQQPNIDINPVTHHHGWPTGPIEKLAWWSKAHRKIELVILQIGKAHLHQPEKWETVLPGSCSSIMDMQLSFVDVWLFLMLNHLTAIHVGPIHGRNSETPEWENISPTNQYNEQDRDQSTIKLQYPNSARHLKLVQLQYNTKIWQMEVSWNGGTPSYHPF